MGESASATEFDGLLHHLQQTRGFDFTAYKRNSLMRRVTKRMETLGLETYEAYLDYLEVHPEEFGALFNTILINVTSFFRDPEVWAALSADIVPALIAERGRHHVIRVWSAGCASGQRMASTPPADAPMTTMS